MGVALICLHCWWRFLKCYYYIAGITRSTSQEARLPFDTLSQQPGRFSWQAAVLLLQAEALEQEFWQLKI